MTTDQLTLDASSLQVDVLSLRRDVADALPRTQGALTTNALLLDGSLANMAREAEELAANVEAGPDPSVLVANAELVLNAEVDELRSRLWRLREWTRNVETLVGRRNVSESLVTNAEQLVAELAAALNDAEAVLNEARTLKGDGDLTDGELAVLNSDDGIIEVTDADLVDEDE